MTPADLYCMGIESNTAGDNMRELCELLGTAYPPQPNDYTVLTGKTALSIFAEEVSASHSLAYI